MKLPKKIDPDRIKDSVVEIKFTSNLPYEIYLGQFFQSLDDTYKYTNRPPLGQNNIYPPIDALPEIKFKIGAPLALFYNDKIKFEIQNGAIVFNCKNEYITWDLYFPEIKKVLNQIHTSKCFNSFNRIGIRYISEYPETEIKSITKFNFSFGSPEVVSDNYSFRSEFKIENSKVILNLSNKIPAFNEDSQKKTISLIDIDVINDNIDIVNLDSLYDLIDKAHYIEKNTFFNLLQESFIESLNPQY